MKKIMNYFLCSVFLSSHLIANQDANKCKSLNGNWAWNGTLNQWQCDDLIETNKHLYAKYIIEKAATDGNTTAAYAQPHNNEVDDSISLKKTLTYAAMPVYVAGAILYYAVFTVVVTPVWLVQKAFGIDQNKR